MLIGFPPQHWFCEHGLLLLYSNLTVMLHL